jgi:hypothetical protein
MNQYGALAQRHWSRWLPRRYQEIPNPDSFFSTLGEEVATEIADLSLDLAGEDPPGEDYLAKLGRLNMARLRAEETVLQDRVLLPPESTEPEEQQTTPASSDWIPLVEDRRHPYWRQAANEDPSDRS